MRIPFFAGNFKMHKTIGETVAYVRELRPLVDSMTGVEIVVGVPFTAVRAAADASRGSIIAVSAQDMSWEKQGAFTGEVSAGMLSEAGARFVIIGHSERRTLFGETDERVNRKVAAAFQADLTPIACIGETLEQREANETFAVLDRQIARGFEGLTPGQVARLVVAYEPVWAIGTGRNATPAQAAEAHGYIRGRLQAAFGAEAADACRILYGGSVKPDNIAELARQSNVDGALVGGACLAADSFFQIVTRGRGTTV